MEKKEDNQEDFIFTNNPKDISTSINFFNEKDKIGSGIISTPAIDYNNYTNVSELNHKGIFQPSDNLIYIYIGCFFKIFPIIFLIFGISFASPSFYSQGFIAIFALILGIIFVIIGILIMFKGYYSIYFLMGENNLTITKKALIGKKVNYYEKGQLEYIEFKYDFNLEDIDKGIRPMHKYILNIVKSNQEIDVPLEVGQNKPLFTVEEMGYFNFIINRHIQNKMNTDNQI